MSRADRRRRARRAPTGPIEHTGQPDRLAGARWARSTPDALVYYTLPYPIWLSALFLLAIAAWTMLSAYAERNWFGAAGLMFVVFAYWLARKAPRERTTLQRDPPLLRIEEGLPLLRTRLELPFADIDGIVIQRNRRADLYRLIAVAGDRRIPIGRSFVDPHEAHQRITALTNWMPEDGPPIDPRLDDDDDLDD